MRSRTHLFHHLRFRRNITNLTTLAALPPLCIVPERIHSSLDLRAQIRADETRLVHHIPTPLTIPPESVNRAVRARLLDNDTYRIREPDGVVRRVSGQQEQFPLVNVDVAECAGGLDGLEQHAAFILVEELGGLVDVVVSACVGPADDHHGHRVVVDAVVVDWGFEQV